MFSPARKWVTAGSNSRRTGSWRSWSWRTGCGGGDRNPHRLHAAVENPRAAANHQQQQQCETAGHQENRQTATVTFLIVFAHEASFSAAGRQANGNWPAKRPRWAPSLRFPGRSTASSYESTKSCGPYQPYSQALFAREMALGETNAAGSKSL